MKQKLLSILALLLVAVSGAWAQDTYTVTFKANNKTKTVENVTLPHTFKCDLYTGDGELDKIIHELYEQLDGGYCDNIIAPNSSGSENVTCGLVDENHFITVSAPFDGTATVTGRYLDPDMGDFSGYSLEITCPLPAPAYTATMKEGTEDADNWSITPHEGLNENDQVTIKYSGSKMVKSIKVKKEAAPEPEKMEFVEFTDGTNTVNVATMNLGATSIADGTSSYGNYYAWGATETFGTVDQSTGTVTATKDGGYTPDNAPYQSGDTFTKYNSTDNLTTLEAADDVVTATLGDEYRMPTKEDFQTLYAACGGTGDKIIDKLPTIEDGAEYNKGIYWVNATAEKPVKAGGYTYKANGVLFVQDATHHVFFPAAGHVDGTDLGNAGSYGYYWASSRFAKWNLFDSGYYMNLGNDTVIPAVDALRCLGHTVRPVKD